MDSLPPLPLRFEPVYKDYLWGGDRIPRTFHRPLPPGRHAEAWELADRPEGLSRVSTGPLAGASLHELTVRFGAQLLGRRVAPRPHFPLLIKLIDARERLSVQVHPDEEAAARLGGEPKTEAWYVLAADGGACVYAGLLSGVTPADFEAAARAGRLETCLQQVPVATGDTLFVPAGRVHAIGGGCLLLEVQQNSNTTYRAYDWNRLDANGRPRELHLRQALQAIHWHDTGPVKCRAQLLVSGPPATVRLLVSCRHFALERLELTAEAPWDNPGDSFHVLFPLDPVRLETAAGGEPLAAGMTCLLPACLARYRLMPAARRACVLRISVP